MKRALALLLLMPASVHADDLQWKAFGFLRLEGDVTQNDPDVAFIGRDDGFELQNARIGFAGLYHAGWGWTGFELSLEGAVDERAGLNATQGTLRVGLKDAYADVGPSTAVWLRAGRFETIFDVDDLLYEPERSFVDRSLESRGVAPTEGFEVAGFAPGRSIGAAVKGDRIGGWFGYEVAVQNGAGEYATRNDNDTPAVSAALLADFYNARSFAFVAGRYNSVTEGELPLLQTENDVEGSVGARLAGDGWVPIVELEAVGRHRTFPTTGNPAENAYGAHAQLMERLWWNPSAEILAGYRWAILEPSDLISTDRVQEHTVGVNLGFKKIPIRVLVNYTHPVEQRTLENDRFEALFELSLAGGGTWENPRLSAF